MIMNVFVKLNHLIYFINKVNLAIIPECYDEGSVQFDFRDSGMSYRLPSVIEKKKGDFTLILKGWSGIFGAIGGYTRSDSGTGLVEVTGLQPNRNYDFDVSVYCSDHCANHYLLVLPDGNKIVPKMHETCCLNLQYNKRLSCDVGIRGCKGASFDPVHSGVYMSDSTGRVVFGFEHEKSDSNPMVKFSGIKIRSCTDGATTTTTTTTTTHTTTTTTTTTSTTTAPTTTTTTTTTTSTTTTTTTTTTKTGTLANSLVKFNQIKKGSKLIGHY